MRPAFLHWSFHGSLRAALTLIALAAQGAQTAAPFPDWAALEEETMRHFQALVRLDTSDPPGHEASAVDYLRGVLEAEGTP